MNRLLVLTSSLDTGLGNIFQGMKTRGIEYFVFTTDDFLHSSNATFRDGGIVLKNGDQKMPGQDVKAVWYRHAMPAQVDPTVKDEHYISWIQQECGTFLENMYKFLGCYWLNNYFATQRAELKLHQLEIAKRVGLRVPRTLVTNNLDELLQFADVCRNNVAIKGLGRQHISAGEKKLFLYTSRLDLSDRQVLERIKYAPHFFQEMVQKKYELRITVVGEELFAAEIASQNVDIARVDWRRASGVVKYKAHNLDTNVGKAILSLMKELGLGYGAIDMIVTPTDDHIFLEVNPTGEFLWIEEATGLNISNTILDHLQSKLR